MLMNSTAKSKLAMVDLDGTLVHTLNANFSAYNKALKEVGFSITKRYFAQHCDGRSYKDFLPEVLGQDRFLIETVHKRKNEIYAGCMQEVQLNLHLISILRAIRPDYYLALVTTASRENVNHILAHFSLSSLTI